MPMLVIFAQGAQSRGVFWERKKKIKAAILSRLQQRKLAHEIFRRLEI
jgi:hypothetical protein